MYKSALLALGTAILFFTSASESRAEEGASGTTTADAINNFDNKVLQGFGTRPSANIEKPEDIIAFIDAELQTKEDEIRAEDGSVFQMDILDTACAEIKILFSSNSAPSAKITSAADVLVTLKAELNLSYTIDEEGDIRIEYQGGHNIWIIMTGIDGKHVPAKSNKRIASLKLIAYPKSADDEKQFQRYADEAQEYNTMYKFKHYAETKGKCSGLRQERNELISSVYRRAQLREVYNVFSSTVFSITGSE